eukprot:jgi/Psemu1/301178/fgenesh1_kg.27_\
MEDSRDILKVMILREKKYYTCTNYLCIDNSGVSATASSPMFVPSLLKVVREIAGLVTDIRNEPSFETKGNDCSTSPNSVCNHCDSLPYSTRASFQQPSTEETWDGMKRPKIHQQECHPKQHLRRRCLHDTLSLCAWRHEILDWAHAVCKAFDIDDSVLETSFNILDRYIAVEISNDKGSGNLPLTREDFQLFGMVSIYIATKTFHGNKRLQLHNLMEMGQGYYTKRDIMETEWNILKALNWHMNPPNVIDYCDVYLALFPRQNKRYGTDKNPCTSPQLSSNGAAKLQVLKYKCQAMVEVVLDDVFFVDKANSVIALAVVLLATDAFRGCGRNASTLYTFLRNVQGVVNIDKIEFDSIIQRLECTC